MIFDDSLEYDGFFPANGAELISMKNWRDIELPDIWIPKTLLPNRDLPMRLNSNKSVLHHTLKKPKPVIGTLSVYSEPDEAAIINHCNSEKLLDSLEDISIDKRWQEFEASDEGRMYLGMNGDCFSNNHKTLNSYVNNFEDISCDTKWGGLETLTVRKEDYPSDFNKEYNISNHQEFKSEENVVDVSPDTIKGKSASVNVEDNLNSLNNESIYNHYEIFKSEESCFSDQSFDNRLDVSEAITVKAGNFTSSFDKESKSNGQETFESEEINLVDKSYDKKWEDCNTITVKDKNCPNFESISNHQEMFQSGENNLSATTYGNKKEECGTTTIINGNCQSNLNENISNHQDLLENDENSFGDLLEHLCLSDSEDEDRGIVTESGQLSKNRGYHSSELGVTDIKNMCTATEKSVPNNICSKNDLSKEIALDNNSFSKLLVNGEGIVDDCKLKKFESYSDLNSLNENKLTFNNISECSTDSNVLNDCEQTEIDKLTCSAEEEDNLKHIELINSNSLLYQKFKEDSPDNVSPKRKVKKEKKSKKKTSNHIPLTNFFLSEVEAQDKQPDVPDYCHYLLQKESSHTPIPEESVSNFSTTNKVFPTLPAKSDAENFELYSQIEEAEAEELRMSLKYVTNLLKESSPTVAKKIVKPEDVANQIKLTLENIPLGVDNETVESILQNYGNITRLTVRRNGIYLKADVAICLHAHIEDPEWIIECLNGSQPFGVSSGAELRCYLKK